jgi:hypothetical protein
VVMSAPASYQRCSDTPAVNLMPGGLSSQSQPPDGVGPTEGPVQARLNSEAAHAPSRAESALKRYGAQSSPAREVPIVQGNRVGTDLIERFTDENAGGVLKYWLDDIFNQRVRYNWSDEQVVQLILERTAGRAKSALDLLTPLQRTDLGQVILTLEGAFYSTARRPSVITAFSRRKRADGESEREYAKQLMILANYAYKDAGQAHVEVMARMQFLAGLRSPALCTHLTTNCRHLRTARELAIEAEHVRACKEQPAVLSDSETVVTSAVAAVGPRPKRGYRTDQAKARAKQRAQRVIETKLKALVKTNSLKSPGEGTPRKGKKTIL